MLTANPIARDCARKLMQLEPDPQTLFTSHRAIFLDLLFQSRLRRHESILARIEDKRTILRVHAESLAFADFAFEDVDPERVGSSD